MVEKIYYSYSDLHILCKEKAHEILTEFKPEVILAIGGGGLIPARMMRSSLNIPIYVVSLCAYDENDIPIKEPRVMQWMDFSLIRDKRILVIDEVDDTRKTLKYLVNKLTTEEQINRENLGFFVLHNKVKDKEISLNDLNIVYYKCGKLVNDSWIVYPWEK
jgi:uncharacterized protein